MKDFDLEDFLDRNEKLIDSLTQKCMLQEQLIKEKDKHIHYLEQLNSKLEKRNQKLTETLDQYSKGR